MSLLKGGVWLALALAMVSCSTSINTDDKRIDQGSGKATPGSVDLPDLGPAPELQNEVWLNTPESLRLSELRGKVVLLEFWTFG